MNLLPENYSADSYGCTSFYLVQNPEGTIPNTPHIVSIADTGYQLPKENIDLYYNNNGTIENNVLVFKSNTDLQATSNVKQNLNENKMEYIVLPNNKPYYELKLAMPSKATIPTWSVNSPEIKSHTVDINKNSKQKSQKTSPPSGKITKSCNSLLKRNTISKTKSKTLLPKTSDQTICLLQFGNTYRSLSDLNEQQSQLVSQAVQKISDPEKVHLKPTIDAVTKTRVTYKVVSPSDLKAFGKNQIVTDINSIRGTPKKKADVSASPDKVTKISDMDDAMEDKNKVKMTRSGRTIKLPKYIQPTEGVVQKTRKKAASSLKCFQCSAEFHGIYQLQRHYEKYPTHTPATVHANMFHCLLAIMKSCNADDKTHIFIQQLELLIGKLKSLFPCLLTQTEDHVGKPCTINEDIGRLLGINPGKYNLNMDAIHCIKDINGYCKHNPQKTINFVKSSDPSKPSQLWLSKHKEEIANIGAQNEDCARTNSIDKWPAFNKRLRKPKPAISSETDKNKNPIIENTEYVDLCEEDNRQVSNEDTILPVISISNTDMIEQMNTEDLTHANPPPVCVASAQSSDIESEPSSTPVKFHSAHFDIRSSPIKPSSNVFNKFQIKPKCLPKFDSHLRQPVFSVNIDDHTNIQAAPDQCLDLHMFKELNSTNNNIQSTLDSIDMACNDTNVEMGYNKEWATTSNIANDHLNENYTSSDYIEPSMMHIQKPENQPMPMPGINEANTNDIDLAGKSHLPIPQGPSVLHLLDSLGNDCLSFPDSELRNNSIDLPLDLFPFNNN